MIGSVYASNGTRSNSVYDEEKAKYKYFMHYDSAAFSLSFAEFDSIPLLMSNHSLSFITEYTKEVVQTYFILSAVTQATRT